MPQQGPAARPETIERAVLDIVGALVAELGLPRAGEAVGLDDSLDHELGLGSLERVELLLRLGQRFGVVLPDSTVASASTPRDLVRAVAAVRPALSEEGPSEPRPPLAPGTAAPDSAWLLTDVLRWHAEHHPERPHLFLRQEDGSERPLHYGELWASASAVAAALFHGGLQHGDTVGLLLRTEPAFFSCFFGVLLAGGVPVPLYPPFRMDRLEEYVERQVGILRNAGGARARHLRRGEAGGRAPEGPSALPPAHRHPGRAGVEGRRGTARAPGGLGRRAHPVHLGEHRRAQGRAAHPRQPARQHPRHRPGARTSDPRTSAVSWLPLYHDMGLIGSWLMPLYYGIPLAILSPLAFLSRPARWLRAMHQHRGTLSAAPNFAYELCVRKVQDAELEGLDLGSWRVALNGSEPVSPDTVERFTRRFAPYGFRPEAMFPVYGLAEVGGRPHLPARGTARPASTPSTASPSRITERRDPFATAGARCASCPVAGRSPGTRCASWTKRAARREERVEGRIEFRGPSMTSGYFRASRGHPRRAP